MSEHLRFDDMPAETGEKTAALTAHEEATGTTTPEASATGQAAPDTPPADPTAAAPAEQPAANPLTATMDRLARIECIRRLRSNPRDLALLGAYVVLAVVILIYAFYRRTYRMDLPPFDYPVARQMWNLHIIERLREGQGLLHMRSGWLELQMHAWTTAHTTWIASIMGWEIWTLARFWSIVFGTLMVAVAPLAVMIACPPGSSLFRRLRVGLIMMVLLAFNSYHITLSRIMMNEPLALLLQSIALVLFLAHYRTRGLRSLAFLALFIVAYILAGWAKIMALFWLPAYGLYIVFNPRRSTTFRLIIAVAAAIACFGLMGLYGLTPFNAVENFRQTFPHHAEQIETWSRNVLWIRTYYGRTLLMLGVPVAFLAVYGLLVAPPIFGITALVVMAVNFIMVNQNLYNYSHIIIPGTALATFAIDHLLRLPSTLSAVTNTDRVRRWTALSARFAYEGAVIALLLVIYFFGRTLTPANPYAGAYRDEALVAIDVIRKHVPEGEQVVNSGIDGNANLMGVSMPYSPNLTLRTGYYLSFERFGLDTMRSLATGWIHWASLAGEPPYLLYSRQIDTLESVAPGEEFLVGALPVSDPNGFHLRRIHIPPQNADFRGNWIVARQGETLTLGLEWANPQQVKLAGLSWQHETIRKNVPPPLRRGGISVYSVGAINIPTTTPENQVPAYTFEIPAGFPTGDYWIMYWGVNDLENVHEVTNPFTLPLRLRILPGEEVPAPDASVTRVFADVYPQYVDRPPHMWSAGRRYANIRREGYSTSREKSFLLSVPGRAPGEYELVIRGASHPNTDPDSPELDWGEVEVTLHGTSPQPVGRLRLSSRSTRNFTLKFTAERPFDTVEVRALPRFAQQGRLPAIFTELIPANYALKNNQQFIVLRGITLRPAAADTQ